MTAIASAGAPVAGSRDCYYLAVLSSCRCSVRYRQQQQQHPAQRMINALVKTVEHMASCIRGLRSHLSYQ